jgi:hypothetical protein
MLPCQFNCGFHLAMYIYDCTHTYICILFYVKFKSNIISRIFIVPVSVKFIGLLYGAWKV